VSYALYLVISSEEVKRIGSLRLTGWASTVAPCASAVLLRPLRGRGGAGGGGLSLLNAVVCTVAPIMMVMMAIERIGAPLTAQTGMVGPLSTISMVCDPRRALHRLDGCWYRVRAGGHLAARPRG
jgi:drug/metabolite transporter (DMT)-like permease